ncbi:4-hydroxybenzoyl-CoA thioesterase [Fulvivirga imtechensis AK7]|uniref:4-hydroxybenzoyl-CoA thioesterase n=1 Tax=Fulvivirga imtechensis AK7 TaxID=1237149 RepID=L8JS38_9BACT|nr:thioesterase family protein [Fulvivirga imtechensis]ELR70187.1 4-hydroxybenzoyl-CoA thioesterase [Fulvivirga imtechensis AK7]
MFQHQTQIRVRYAETDQMGYVYYGNYAAYYEVARVESLRSLGLSYRQLEEQGVMMPVLENKSKYIAPATYDELLTIKTTIHKAPKVRILFHYEIYNESDKLIHTGETMLVFINMKTGRPCGPPEAMVNLLRPFFE